MIYNMILRIGKMAITRMVISQLFSIQTPTIVVPTTAPQRHHIKLMHNALARKYVGTNSRSAPPNKLMTTPGRAINNTKEKSCGHRPITKISANPQEDEMTNAAMNIALRGKKNSINQQMLQRIIQVRPNISESLKPIKPSLHACKFQASAQIKRIKNSNDNNLTTIRSGSLSSMSFGLVLKRILQNVISALLSRRIFVRFRIAVYQIPKPLALNKSDRLYFN